MKIGKNRKGFSLFLALCMVFSMLPVTVQAAPDTGGLGTGGETEKEAVCICTEPCTEDSVNADCPVCSAKGADLSQCKGKIKTDGLNQEEGQKQSGEQTDEQVKAVQEMINALPTVEALSAMSPDGQQQIYDQVQAAYDACQALQPEQKVQVTGTEVFDSLFNFFNGMTNTLASNVPYINENGNLQTVSSATGVTSGMTTLSGGWYVVNNNITIASRITVSGDVHLILQDNCTLNASEGITVNSPNKLTIYGQSQQSGKLSATGGMTWAAAIGSTDASGVGPIKINGGVIIADNSNEEGAGIGGGRAGDGETITINGGNVTAFGGPWCSGIGGGTQKAINVIINGGVVNATGSLGNSKDFCNGSSGGSGAKLIIENAFVCANDMGMPSGYTAANSIVFYKNTGDVYGNPTLTQDVTIPDGKFLTIPKEHTLTIAEGTTFTNNGTIQNDGTIHVDSTAANALQGTIGGKVAYKLTIDSVASGYYASGESVTPSPSASVGQKANGFKDSGGNPYDATFNMPAHALELTTVYENAPTFTVTIPAEVTLGETATVSASGVNVVSGSSLKVTISTDSGEFKLVNMNTTTSPYYQALGYFVKKDNDSGTALSSGDIVLTIEGGTANSSGSQTLYFSKPTPAPKYSDPYTGTVTFTVRVE